MNDLKNGANLVFMFDDKFAFEDDEVKMTLKNYKLNLPERQSFHLTHLSLNHAGEPADKD